MHSIHNLTPSLITQSVVIPFNNLALIYIHIPFKFKNIYIAIYVCCCVSLPVH